MPDSGSLFVAPTEWPDDLPSPERAMWLAVILQAFDDLLMPVPTGLSNAKQKRQREAYKARVVGISYGD